MRVFVAVAVFVLACILSIASPSRALMLDDFDSWRWTYDSPLYDLSPESVLGSRADFDKWRDNFAAVFKAKVDAVPLPTPLGVRAESAVQMPGYKLQPWTINWPGDTVEDHAPVGGLLATPDVLDPTKPLIIALHGHEVEYRGTNPVKLFTDHWWPEKLAQAGYVVWAPSHLFYTQFARLYRDYDYHIVWTRAESLMLDAMRNRLPRYRGQVVAGLSSGGTTGAFLMAYRPDIDAGILAACFVSLDWLRENYRIAGHPNNWDVRFLLSYLPVYALIAPRPVEWQLGRKDAFFPRLTPLGPVEPIFPGTPRGIDTAESVGEFLVLERIWKKFGAAPSLYLHDGGHEFAADEALRFIANLAP